MSGTEPTYEGHTPCPDCGLYLEVGDWPFCPHESTRKAHHTVHANERVVVFENPATGEIRYPGRNDIPVPKRYADQGFVRKELPSLRSVEKFERQHGVRNDLMHYNPGNSADQEKPTPPPGKSDREKREIWKQCMQEVGMRVNES
jgi:hypothetical protein